MTLCPWFSDVSPHDTVPDPAASALSVGEARVCQVCRLPWVVAAADPYVLVRQVAAALATVETIMLLGTDAAQAKYGPLLDELGAAGEGPE